MANTAAHLSLIHIFPVGTRYSAGTWDVTETCTGSDAKVCSGTVPAKMRSDSATADAPVHSFRSDFITCLLYTSRCV